MSAVGAWKLTMMTPFGEQTPTITIIEDGGACTGTFEGSMGSGDLENLVVGDNDVSFGGALKTPMGTINLDFTGTVDGDAISGSVATPMGAIEFTGERI